MYSAYGILLNSVQDGTSYNTQPHTSKPTTSSRCGLNLYRHSALGQAFALSLQCIAKFCKESKLSAHCALKLIKIKYISASFLKNESYPRFLSPKSASILYLSLLISLHCFAVFAKVCKISLRRCLGPLETAKPRSLGPWLWQRKEEGSGSRHELSSWCANRSRLARGGGAPCLHP